MYPMKFLDLPSGSTVTGEKILAYKTKLESSKYIYLMAGVHGDEPEGIYVLDKLFAWLKKQIHFELPLIVIPIVNVDGFKKKTRTNQQGVDLNRNLPTEDWSAKFSEAKYNPGNAPLSEPENQFLNSLFLKYRPGFILSFHSWKPILNYNGDCRDVAQFIAKFNQYPLDDDIGYATPGSLGTYGPKNLAASVLTFECPTKKEKSLEVIWKENEEALTLLMQSDLIRKKYE